MKTLQKSDANGGDLNVEVREDGTVQIVPVEGEKPEDKEAPNNNLKTQ